MRVARNITDTILAYFLREAADGKVHQGCVFYRRYYEIRT